MPASVRFQRLQRRITVLKDRLIPATRPTGNYTAKEQDLIRSYRLLAHAEFESFLEDRVLEIADQVLQNFKKGKKTGNVLASLMTFSPLSPQSPPSSLNSKGIDSPNTRVHRVIAQFKESVSSANHGIKEANVFSLLFPIGFVDSEMDATLLGTLNSYGGDRGSTAHSSAHTQRPIDPVTEVGTVTWITAEFAKLDALLSSKKREC